MGLKFEEVAGLQLTRPLEIHTHQQRLEELEAAVNWLRDLIEVPQSSRFPTYVRIWKAIVDGADLPSGGTSREGVNKIIARFGKNEFRGATHEAYDLVKIHKAFKNDDDILPRALLEKVVKGNFSEIEERSSKESSLHPRNFLFELSAAARFKSCGFPVELTGEADVEFNFRTYRIFVECKRLFGSGSFERNFRKGTKQLRGRFQRYGLPKNKLGLKPLGILLFSINKVLNPTQSYMAVSSSAQPSNAVNEETLVLMRANEKAILENIDPNILMMGFYTNISLLLSSNPGSHLYWNFFPYHELKSKHGKVATAILSKLERPLAD